MKKTTLALTLAFVLAAAQMLSPGAARADGPRMPAPEPMGAPARAGAVQTTDVPGSVGKCELNALTWGGKALVQDDGEPIVTGWEKEQGFLTPGQQGTFDRAAPISEVTRRNVHVTGTNSYVGEVFDAAGKVVRVSFGLHVIRTDQEADQTTINNKTSSSADADADAKAGASSSATQEQGQCQEQGQRQGQRQGQGQCQSGSDARAVGKWLNKARGALARLTA